MIHNQNLNKIQQTSFETSTKKNQLFKLEFLKIFTTASLLKEQLFCNYCRVLFLKTTGKRQKKTIEKGEKKRKMRESQTTTSIFLLVLFSIEKFIFCQKIYLEELSLYCYICITVFFHVTVYWKCRNKTLTPIQICIGFLDTVLRTKILDNSLVILK